MDTFLKQDPKNVVALHCKAGKGRTGTAICCYMLHTGVAQSASEACDLFGKMRTMDGKGVTIPSQIRYISYYHDCLKHGFPLKQVKIVLKRVELQTTPRFDPDGGCDPYFIVNQAPQTMSDLKMKVIYNSKKTLKTKHVVKKELVTLDGFEIELEGDYRIDFWDADTFSSDDKMFSFWFNTNFLDLHSKKFTLQKSQLDSACKDKHNKRRLHVFFGF